MSTSTLSLLADAGCANCWQQYIVFFPHALRWLRALEPALGFFPLGAQTLTVGSSPTVARPG